MMSRPPGVLSETGLYHIIFRGINYQNLFEEKQDYYHNLIGIGEVRMLLNIILMICSLISVSKGRRS